MFDFFAADLASVRRIRLRTHSKGVLRRRMKEMIATYVSALNECPYCLDSHAASLFTQGGNEALFHALVTGNLEDDSISTPERHLLEFVRTVTVESYKVDEAEILKLRASGWNEKQIAESIHMAAMFACLQPGRERLRIAIAGSTSASSPGRALSPREKYIDTT